MASQDKPAKVMSSRLLTMKFMQRAAASSTPSTTEKQSGRPSKRPRLSEPSATDVPNANIDGVQAALAAEELKRTKALDRQAAEAGDTKWTLHLEGSGASTNSGGLQVVHTGYSAIDSERLQEQLDEEQNLGESEPGNFRGAVARKSFGSFGKRQERRHDPSKDGSRASSSREEDDEEESDSSAQGEDSKGYSSRDEIPKREKSKTTKSGDEIRAARKAKRKEERQDAAQRAERRRNKEIKLSISDRRSNTKASPLSSGAGGCFKCGSLDHKKRDCPGSRSGAGGSPRGVGR